MVMEWKYYRVFEEIAEASPVFRTVQKEVGQSTLLKTVALIETKIRGFK